MEEKNSIPTNENFNGREDNSEIDINSDENIPGTSHLNDPLNEGEEDEAEKCRTELQEQKEKYLRLFAEFDNARRRQAREKIELIQTAGKDIISSLLEVLDDMDRAEKQFQSTTEIEPLKEGVVLVFNKLRNVLQSKGLKPMESIGQEFDVEKHDAVTEIPAPDPSLKGKIVDEVTKGYYLNDKIIRHAKAIVGK